MKKKETITEHKERINEVLYHIYKNLSSKLIIEDLAQVSSYSPFHFQRIFKEITNKSVVGYIKDLRLQWAANLLIFNPESTITEVAHNCGLNSSATLTNEFKKYFDMTPSSWRKGGYEKYKKENPLINEKAVDFSKIVVKKIEPIEIAYMRHQGYDKSIKNMWQKFLHLLEVDHGVSHPVMMAFHHSNPNITNLEDCRYIACIALENHKVHVKGDIGLCNIEGGLYATIRYEGEYNDVLHLYKKLYHEWLPLSEFEALSSAAHMIYYKNHFIEEDGKFDIEFRIPVAYK